MKLLTFYLCHQMDPKKILNISVFPSYFIYYHSFVLHLVSLCFQRPESAFFILYLSSQTAWSILRSCCIQTNWGCRKVCHCVYCRQETLLELSYFFNHDYGNLVVRTTLRWSPDSYFHESTSLSLCHMWKNC